MTIQFTAHNVRLDDGTYTKPDEKLSIDADKWFVSTRKILENVLPGEKSNYRIADLGCLEGGYAVEFARMGFNVLGVEIRDSNLEACNYIKSKTNLPNLEFVKDDAFNIDKYGIFDAIFCCGLLYHLDKPKLFLDKLAAVTTKLVILQTHFSTSGTDNISDKFRLSELMDNEGLSGRWFTEFQDDNSFAQREDHRWSAWDNRRSFWIQREYLLQAIQTAGFDVVLEQFDSLGPEIAETMLHGYYRTDRRGTFIGLKTSTAQEQLKGGNTAIQQQFLPEFFRKFLPSFLTK